MNKVLLSFTLVLALAFSASRNNLHAQGKTPQPKEASKGKSVSDAADPKSAVKSNQPVAAAAPAAAAKTIDARNVGRAPGKYSIKVKLKGFKNVDIFLADNFGDKQYFRDTCRLDANGVGTFTGSPKLQRGIYMVVFPGMDGYYELPITDDQEFYFEADTLMDETTVKVVGSLENEAFAEYQKLRAVNGKLRYQLEQEMKKAKSEGNDAVAKGLKTEIDTLIAQDSRFRDAYMAKNPGHLLTKLFKAFKQIHIPENPNPADSMFAFRYFKAHYWDNVDFSESGLIRAPQGLLTAKLNDFMDRISYQDPDSLVASVDQAISKTIPYTETQKYFIQYLTNKYQDKKIMCMDNVTIHLIHKYYCEGDAWWYDDTAQKRKMCEDARKSLPTLCGKTAPDLKMADTLGKYHRLYENLGLYTILFFYDPTCGHCKEVIPVVNKVFQKHKMNGIKVYAVSTENQYDEWRKMMRSRPELQEWINVCRTDRYFPWPIFKQDYNIVANPTIFILDAQGRILGKKIHEDQLEFFIESLLYDKGIIKTKPTPPKESKDDKKGGNDIPEGHSSNDGHNH